MSETTVTAADSFERPLTRREVLKRGAFGTAIVFGSSIAFAPKRVWAAEKASSITIGTFQDPALTPIRDYFNGLFTKETGIKVNYHETSYNAWYQNAKNDGLNKTGAYDIYIMDDNWVPEFAAGRIIQSLDKLGFKVNPDILEKGVEQGLWPPKRGAKMKAFAKTTPELYAIVNIDDVEILYYNKTYFPHAPQTWDDIYKVGKADFKPGKLYGWSARGVKGNPIVQTYLPLMSSYGANFVNPDWTPGFAGPAGVAALERLFSFIPFMPPGVAEFDTSQEVPVLLQGKCTALTEYTGSVHVIDDPTQSKVVGKIDTAATPKQERHGPAIGTFICGVASGAKNTSGAIHYLEWFTSSRIQKQFARRGGSAAVTGSALHDPVAVKKYRWLPAIADAINTSIPKPRTPDEPKMEDILGTALNEALIEAIAKKSGYQAIAQKHLSSAATQITAYLKQQGGYF